MDHFSINLNQHGQLEGQLVMDCLKPKQKYVRVTFSNGVMFDIPAKTIASNRAQYYEDSKKEESVVPFSVYNEEFKFTIENNYELVDWLLNNMDWKDVEQDAIQVESDAFNYHQNWRNVSSNESVVIER